MPYLHAEWTKLRTTTGSGWLLLAVVVLTVALSAAVSAATTAVPCPRSGCEQDVARIGLAGVALGQAAVAILAVLAISGEHATGMIRTTFTAMPRRARVLAAKAVLLTGSTVASATLAVLACVLVGWLVLPGNGFIPEHGHRLLSLTDGPVLRAAVGSVLYLGLIVPLGLGVGAAVRDAGAAIGVVLGLLYLFPVAVRATPDPDWQRLLWQLSPGNAGLAVQSTTDLCALPVTPWAGLGVLAAWSAAALVAGGLAQRRGS